MLECFDADGDAHTAADTQSGNTAFQAGSFECMNECDKYSGAGSTERMTKSNGATIYIDLKRDRSTDYRPKKIIEITFSGLMRSSRITATDCAANASFNSNKSTDSTVQFAFCKASRIALIGAKP